MFLPPILRSNATRGDQPRPGLPSFANLVVRVHSADLATHASTRQLGKKIFLTPRTDARCDSDGKRQEAFPLRNVSSRRCRPPRWQEPLQFSDRSRRNTSGPPAFGSPT